MKLTLYKKTLEDKLVVFQQQDNAILELVGDDDVELEIEQADILRENMQSTILEIENTLTEITQSNESANIVIENSPTPPTPQNSSNPPTPQNNQTETVLAMAGFEEMQGPGSPSQSGITTQSSHQMNQPSVKLPKLNLKKFRGDITTWSTFWDTFESAIDKNPSLSDIDKFNYLNSLLENTAADAISGLTLTSGNYNEAIVILKKRFGNKQLAINEHMDILLNLDPVTSVQNLKGLRSLYDTVESHIRALKSLGIPSQSYGNLLCSMLMNKLPQDLRILISRDIKNDNWDLDRLLELLEAEVEARERATSNSSAGSSNLHRNPQPKLQGRQLPSGAVLQTGGSTISCTYCQGPHTSNSCKTVSNVTARKDILRKGGRCFLCLKKNHLCRDCNSKTQCFKCRGRHHISICTKDSNERKSENPANVQKGAQQDQGLQAQQKTGSENNPLKQQTNLFVSSKTPVLLQTAQATITQGDHATVNSAKVRVILDSGSQRSYITNRVRNQLNLPTEKTETMVIKTFGSEEERIQTCDSVKFVLKSQHDQAEISLSAYAVPMICEPLQHQFTSQAQQSYDHLRDLNLADCSTGIDNSEVDVLIGCDQYWDLVTGEVRRGENGPTAVGTRLGWVLSGPVEDERMPISKPATNLATTHVLRCATSPTQTQNRAMEIRNLVSPNSWRHCPGRDNPADIPSRGINPSELADSILWHSGPDWLGQTNTEKLEDGDEQCVPPEECLAEMKITKPPSLSTLILSNSSHGLNEIIRCERFGTLKRLLRVTAYVLRFVKAVQHKKDGRIEGGSLSANEIDEAHTVWMKEMQRTLPEKGEFEHWKVQFDLYLDEKKNVWRCKGRLEKANLPLMTKHPIILDKNHYLTTLIIRECHKKVMHNGVKETLTELRSQYWLVRGRQFIRTQLGKCATCRRFEGKPYQAPPAPPLPPFTATGIDFLGPLYVKTREENPKVWICLYTCCVVRALHLDVVPNLTSEGFMRSFRRFTARRGIPPTIITDNGGTFKPAAKEITTILTHPDVKKFFAGKRITWHFNLEKAPWWGGFFERLVKSMKRCLKKTLGTAKLTYEELLTATVEVEMILNSRPLSYISTEDFEEPLTPSNLLIGRRLLSLPEPNYNEDDPDFDIKLDTDDLTRTMRHLSNVMNHFWSRWRNEYLMELRESHRVETRNGNETVSLGDIVVVHEESRPRGLWRLGKVESLISGADGQTRGAVVKVFSKKGRSTTIKRPVQRLYPLEIRSTARESELPVEAKDDDKPEVTRTRPRRAAAIEADNRRKRWIKDLDL